MLQILKKDNVDFSTYKNNVSTLVIDPAQRTIAFADSTGATILGNGSNAVVTTEVVLASSGGTAYALTVSDDGTLSTEAIASGDINGAASTTQLTAPNGTIWAVSVDDDGTLITTQL